MKHRPRTRTHEVKVDLARVHVDGEHVGDLRPRRRNPDLGGPAWEWGITDPDGKRWAWMGWSRNDAIDTLKRLVDVGRNRAMPIAAIVFATSTTDVPPGEAPSSDGVTAEKVPCVACGEPRSARGRRR